jgi:NADH:ubiquinone oxidoreductase subunit 6 (subunit J)
MKSEGLKRGIIAAVVVAFNLLVANAVMADTGRNNSTPWYAAWYLWVGLGIFIIVVVSIVGASERKDPGDSR